MLSLTQCWGQIVLTSRCWVRLKLVENSPGLGPGRVRCSTNGPWVMANQSFDSSTHQPLDPLNPHRDTVLPMAEEGGGIPIWVPDDFVPNGTTTEGIPSLSAQTHAVGGALRRMVNDGFHQKHLCFILSTAEALCHNPHISPSQWAAKAGHEKGRNCNNCSWGSLFHPALNSDALREWARDRWGPIQHPTVEDFVRMIEKFASDAVARGEGSKKIRIWKMDIAGAYTQLTYRAEDVHLMACALPGDLVAFFTRGTFGWGAMPFAFSVITKAIVWQLNEGPH